MVFNYTTEEQDTPSLIPQAITLCRCHVECAVRLNETRSLLQQFYARGALRLQRRIDHQQPGAQFHTSAARSTARRPVGPFCHLKSSLIVKSPRGKFASRDKNWRSPSAHLAHRIDLLLRARRARRLHAFLFLDERHERAPFTAATIAESPRPHFQADPACIGAFRPHAPVGGFAKRVVARRRDYVVVALILAAETTREYSKMHSREDQIYLANAICAIDAQFNFDIFQSSSKRSAYL